MEAAQVMRAAGLSIIDTIEHLSLFMLLHVLDPGFERRGVLSRLADCLMPGVEVLELVRKATRPAECFNTEVFPSLADAITSNFPGTPVQWIVDGFQPKISDDATILRVLEITESLGVVHHHRDVPGALYEQLIGLINEAGYLGQYFTPRHIVDFMLSIVGTKPGDSIYDPAAGTGGFLVQAGAVNDLGNSPVQLYGREINHTVSRLLVINFVLNGLDPIGLSRGDSLANDTQDSNRYDVVLTNPPFGGQIGNKAALARFPITSSSTEALLLQHVVDSLRPGGRAAVICPEGLLANLGSDRQVREHVLRECEVDAVVSLPGGVFFPYTGVKTGILRLTKGPGRRPIWFYDVRHDGFSLDMRRRRTEYSDLPAAASMFAHDDTNAQSVIVSRELLKANDYKFVASRYVHGARQRSTGIHREVQLGDVCRVRKEQVGTSNEPDAEFLCLGLEHIESWTGRVELPSPARGSSIKSVKNCFRSGDILYGKLRPYLAKVAHVEFGGICSTELVVLVPDAEIIAPRLLGYLLRTSRLVEAAESLMSGANHPRIHPTDILKLPVPVPPMADQLVILQELTELEDRMRKAREDIEASKLGVRDRLDALWTN
jgi:type I restriction enzyme M protein